MGHFSWSSIAPKPEDEVGVALHDEWLVEVMKGEHWGRGECVLEGVERRCSLVRLAEPILAQKGCQGSHDGAVPMEEHVVVAHQAEEAA
jgi:hypothetical protein